MLPMLQCGNALSRWCSSFSTSWVTRRRGKFVTGSIIRRHLATEVLLSLNSEQTTSNSPDERDYLTGEMSRFQHTASCQVESTCIFPSVTSFKRCLQLRSFVIAQFWPSLDYVALATLVGCAIQSIVFSTKSWDSPNLAGGKAGGKVKCVSLPYLCFCVSAREALSELEFPHVYLSCSLETILCNST